MDVVDGVDTALTNTDERGAMPGAGLRGDPIRALVGGTGPAEWEGLVLRCACCGLPWARVQGGALVVVSRHHGEQHVNVVALTELRRMGEAATELNG